MPQVKIVCKEEMGFPIPAVEPKASGRGVLPTDNLLVLRQFSLYNETMFGFFCLACVFRSI